MAEAAKVDRTTAKRLFTISNKQIRQAIQNNLGSTVIKNRFNEVNKSWGSVMAKHAGYLALAYPDDDEDVPQEAEEWIDKISLEFNKSEQVYNEYLNQLPAGTSKDVSDDVKKAAKMSKFEGVQLEVAVSSLDKVTKHNDATIDSIKEAQREMKAQLDRFKAAQRNHMMLMDDMDEKDSLMLERMQELCLNANIAADKEVENKRGKVEAANKEEKKGASNLKIDKIKLPLFSGEIRDYPQFYKDFTTVVMPEIKEKSAPYVLKSCLKDEALDVVKNIDDDIGKMWERLEECFGGISKLTDAVMYDIKMLKPVTDGEDKKFVALVNCIEKGYRELERIGMGAEISNSSIVGLIEEKLPKTIKTMWCLQVSDVKSTVDKRNKFPSLLEFLKQHRRATEYGSNELRSTKHAHFGKGVVSHAGLEGQEPRQPAREKMDVAPSSSTVIKKSGAKQGYCWIHQSLQHDILNCSSYIDKDPQERMMLVQDFRACWCCLRTGHYHYDCYNLRECSTNGCKITHHPTLHEDRLSREGRVKAQFQSPGHATPCLLQLMRVTAGKKIIDDMNVMWDSGATVCLITFKKARELGLVGEKVAITIVKVGGEKELIESRIYEVPVHDSTGMVEYFQAYGIPRISSAIEVIETDRYAVLLDVEPNLIRRPKGEVEMLIGLEYAGFHPDKEKILDHLVLFKNRFGCCLGGTHNQLIEKTQKLVQEVTVAHAKIKIDDFYESESLGVACQPRCGSCKCGQCPIGGKQYTLQQERELAMIESGMEHRDGVWFAKYPWIRSPDELPDNYSSTLAMLRSTEKRIGRDERLSKMYISQINDMVERGVARKLEMEEIQAYKGPLYYISHHDVMNPESDSTPCRIVFNSSAKFNNNVLNDYWAKGPDLLNNLLGILLRFRENRVAIAGDIRKMYHTVKIEGVDQQTHRFLWRDLEDRAPDVYVMTSVSFGDRPAGAIAAVALRKTAEMSQEEYPKASETIIKNSYVDDVIGSYDNQEEASGITNQIDEVLSRGGFKMKEWRVSGQTTEKKLEISTNDGKDEKNPKSKVLGIVWNAANDMLEFRAKLNFSPKHRKVRTEPDIKEEEIPDRIPPLLTKRLLLSQVNGIYDPLGIASPFTVRAKILLRKLNSPPLDWDDPIPEEERMEWVEFFTDLFDMERVKIARSTKPITARGKPVLIIFSDASEDAFGACAYIRWEVDAGRYESRLLLAKSRLAPLKKITIVRLELNAALLSARLREFIISEAKIEFSRTYLLVDSEIVRAMTQKESYGFNTFVAVRVGEIQ
jgi:hypothetical protein